MDTLHYLQQIHAADCEAVGAVGRSLAQAAAAVDGVASRIEGGGRLFYIGAGTSGRLCVLDAAELPPTFGIDPKFVTAIVAGGPGAVFESREGAEDDAAAGARDLEAAGLFTSDAVVGLAASGATPYVAGALDHAKRKGCFTVAIVCVTGSLISQYADVTIEADTGREVVAGSTRMKAGTAQKMILNMLSTAVFAKRGLVYRGEMVAMRPANDKLRKRAVRIVKDLLAAEEPRALELLEMAGWHLPTALVAGRLGVGPERAREALAAARGNVALVLDSGPFASIPNVKIHDELET